jgi:lysophospholipase L1-like esterase
LHFGRTAGPATSGSAFRRGWPALALIALLCACAPVATRAPIAAVDPPSADWSADMAAYAAEDAAHPPPRDAVVFTGSSSIHKWESLAADFPGVPVLNRGFGGSQLRDAVWHADAVALRYRPRLIVLYAGDNDIDAGRTPKQVLQDFRAFVARIRRDQPSMPIDFIAIKPSPVRAAQIPAQRVANALVRTEAAHMTHVRYIDVATPMLDRDGKPRGELFGNDGLHMNRMGYALWTRIVAPYLRDTATAP